MLNEIIHHSGEQDTREIVLAMAHRGRLNVLINVMGKSPEELFSEFEGKKVEELSAGDVKYHQGFSCDIKTSKDPMHLTLAFNPSHLEIVSPVACGSVRARQERRSEREEDHNGKVIAVIVHGDAAFAGQGVVMESFNMSQTRGYTIDGTIHIVVNNQIGFTTSQQYDSRSTYYATDVAKMVNAPILHVNGDDPEAVAYAAQVALDYRLQFNKDVVIDLVCYRRHGHNEADEPAMTQPAYKDKLASGKPAVETLDYSSVPPHLIVNWNSYIGREWTAKADTRFDLKTMQAMVKRFHNVPEHMVIHRQIKKILDQRDEMAEGKRPVDWGMGETLAYATLKKRQAWVPLKHVSDNQGRFTVIDSVLSEEAVLAFEYGFATTSPNTLNIWEAQFGDFVNGAQVVIDQFISSGEQKWGRLCGLVMFLPHGYEGMGAEHSSARLERFMQLCAEQNMQVCVPSTPAQTFHMLRRQMLRPYRRPLIVMTPKSLLRNPAAVSTMEELAEGNFKTIIDDARFSKSKQDVERIVMCSGKVYYDLLAKSEEEKVKNIPLIRLEQLYPHPEKLMKKMLESYPNLKELVWCQEEPRNQGAWDSAKHRFRKFEGQYKVTCVSRPSAAAPAVEIRVPQLPESVSDASIAAWVVKEGDSVTEDQNLLELETDKVVLEVPAPASGVIMELKVEEGDTVLAGDLLGTIDETATAAPAAEAEESSSEAAGDSANASPSVRKTMAENDLSGSDVAGSGKNGRILKGDVESHLNKPAAAPAAAKSSAPAVETMLNTEGREERRVPMTRLRAKIAERLLSAQQTSAILTTFNEVDLTEVMRLRKKYQDRFTKVHDIKLGFMSFFIKAATEALKRYPEHVSSERGLVVPILRNTDGMGNADIEKAIADYATRARSGHLELNELTGGTFSITNGGTFGSMLSTPILNPPQSAILGMHNIQQRPMAINGQVEIRPMMYLALSYDHRLIDGQAAVASWLKSKNY
ncbi:2-oxoglutarate dehydrogenase E1 component [Nymphon striatum]|nr:2-oxoglutarate dehydrogenase E1 component [Nymphon striatum]